MNENIETLEKLRYYILGAWSNYSCTADCEGCDMCERFERWLKELYDLTEKMKNEKYSIL